MNNQTKIIVLRQKNLIYVALALVIMLLLIILILQNRPSNTMDDPEGSTEYIAGVYSSTIVLNGNPVDIQITMDNDKIHDISLVNAAQSVTTMYPIFNSCFDEIRSQVIAGNSPENIQYSDNNRYTSIVITKAIENAINKSRPN